MRRATAFTLTDLRKGPAILVGAFNNSWTMRLDHDLRFTYVWNNETHTGFIRDRQNPNNRNWVHDPAMPYSQLTQDYAVVSRFMDPLTEKMLVVVGGMGRDGTIAAGEFVTEPRYLEKLAAHAPRHWDRMNLQVVLATDIVKGNTGPPRIVATSLLVEIRPKKQKSPITKPARAGYETARAVLFPGRNPRDHVAAALLLPFLLSRFRVLLAAGQRRVTSLCLLLRRTLRGPAFFPAGMYNSFQG